MEVENHIFVRIQKYYNKRVHSIKFIQRRRMFDCIEQLMSLWNFEEGIVCVCVFKNFKRPQTPLLVDRSLYLNPYQLRNDDPR